MKGKFVQEKGKICFQDAWGTYWSENVLDDLTKGLRKYKDAKETIEYYEDMASKVKVLGKEESE